MLCGDDPAAAQSAGLVGDAEARILFVRCGGALDDDNGGIERAEFERLAVLDQQRIARRKEGKGPKAVALPQAAPPRLDEIPSDPELEA